MHLKKIILTVFLLTFASTGVVLAAGSEQNCTPNYGGGTTCAQTGLVLDKKVKNPQTDAFVDNLTVNDPKYAPNQAIAFRLTVTNTGTTDYANVTVTDTLPSYLTGTKSSGAKISGNTLTETVTSLKAGESKSFDVQATTAALSALPTDQAITCVVNKAHAASGDATSDDTAAYCIQTPTTAVPATTKGGLPVYETPNVQSTPKTGPELYGLVSLLTSAVGGFMLRRNGKK